MYLYFTSATIHMILKLVTGARRHASIEAVCIFHVEALSMFDPNSSSSSTKVRRAGSLIHTREDGND